MTEAELRSCLDNDVVVKSAAYGLSRTLWPELDAGIGILGTARFVVPTRLQRLGLAGGIGEALSEFEELLERAHELQPDDGELRLAAEFETASQRAGLQLDGGECQLAAMVIRRRVAALETGDKRAIRSIEELRTVVAELDQLDGRVRCLEQVVAATLRKGAAFDVLVVAVCGQPNVDNALWFSFACSSPSASADTVLAGLSSYVEALRREAPHVLSAG